MGAGQGQSTGRHRSFPGRLLPLLRFLLPLVQAFILIALIHQVLGRSPLDFRATWSDEVIYWLEARSFVFTGFSGGYFCFDGNAPFFGWNPFRGHGPGFPVLAGVFGYLLHWHPAYPVFMNLALVAAASAFALGSRDATPLSRALVVIALALYYPIYLYAPAMMQECTHYAFAILWAPLALPSLRGPVSRRRFGSLIGLLAVVSLIKPTWSLMALFLAVVEIEGEGRAARRVRRGLLLLAPALLFLVYTKLISPIPDNPFGTLKAGGVPELLEASARKFARNVAALAGGKKMALYVRLCTLLLLAGVAVRTGLRRAGASGRVQGMDRRETVFHAVNLVAMPLMVLLFWKVMMYKDFRVMAPHLLSSLMLVCMNRRVPEAAGYAVLCALFLAPFVGEFKELQAPHFADPAKIDRGYEEFAADIAGVIRYEDGAGRWENTVSDSGLRYYTKWWLAALPPGIGVNINMSRDAYLTDRARYMIADEFVEDVIRRTGYRLVKRSAYGSIYVNPAHLPPSPAPPGPTSRGRRR